MACLVGKYEKCIVCSFVLNSDKFTSQSV